VVEDFQHDLSRQSGLAADVFEHQQPSAEQETEAGTEDPDRRAHQPAGAQYARATGGEDVSQGLAHGHR
jgi:hypothetical protein